VLIENRKLKTAMVLHGAATWLYIMFAAFLIMLLLEFWKGVELIQYINDYWFSFGGARETIAYAILCLVVGRALDSYAKRLNPRLKYPWRGWHFKE